MTTDNSSRWGEGGGVFHPARASLRLGEGVEEGRPGRRHLRFAEELWAGTYRPSDLTRVVMRLREEGYTHILQTREMAW